MISELRTALAQSSNNPAQNAQILVRPPEVVPLVQDVIRNADLEKDALGFLPEDVYHTAANSGHLLIASRTEQDGPKFLGHLLFGGAFPHARVYQLYVVPEARGKGIARALVGKLVQMAEENGFMDIAARAAADLPANAVWERLGFPTARIQAGGHSRKRVINVRVRILNTPTLFGYPEGKPVSGLPVAMRPAPSYIPVYAADLNVFFDVIRRRSRAEHASKLISAAMDNVIRLVVAEEFVAELKRSFTPGSPDPVYEFSLQLPTIPRPEAQALLQLETELAALIFPERAAANTLTTRDRSDLIHLATAIIHSVDGFVTAERALIKASDELEVRYGMRVIDVEHIAHVLQAGKTRVTTVENRFAGRELHLSELTGPLNTNLDDIINKIPYFNAAAPRFSLNAVRSSHDRSLAVSFDGSLVCAAIWRCSAAMQRKLSATVIADEDHPAIESAVDALFLALSEEAVIDGPAVMELAVPDALTVSSELALSLGFVPAKGTVPGATIYQRMAIGRPTTAQNWPMLKSLVAKNTGSELPDQIPAYTDAHSKISFKSVDGSSHLIRFDDLETALAPVILCSPGRNVVLVPIRRKFADYLLNTSHQLTLLPSKPCALFHERVYYSTERNSKLFIPGSAIIFYESSRGNGRSCAIAMARVRGTATVSKTEVASTLIRHGVLDKDEIGQLTTRAAVAATVFDNVLRFSRPVSLQVLRELECIDGTNLIRPRRLNLHQVNAIVERGYSIER